GALALTGKDRGITSLPLHYCYGLSVLHAHLYAGGSVALSAHSVLDDTFWETVDQKRVTTLAAVPHTLQLLETTEVLHHPHPSLRLVTQAGGRLAPERVERTARLGREQGWDLAVMYGQTEATARIAVLDPSLALDHPDAVGAPVPGTQVHVDTSVPGADPAAGVGELVVTGPGVMMGYALHPDDLACGPMLRELRTGDLARVDEQGIIRIAGRRSLFVKVMGVRVDLGALEHRLEAEGLIACVTGDDTGLRVAVEPSAGPDDAELTHRARLLAGEGCGLGVAVVEAAVLRLPRLPGGKIDRQRCDALVRAAVAGPDGGADSDPSAVLTRRVAGRLATVLGRKDVDLERSFVQLGGDSLSHVRASMQLEELLGPLPGDWHHQPLRRLIVDARRPSADETPGDGRRTVEMSVLLRAVAVIAICGSHADLFRILGGAHTLLTVAGFNAARFGLSTPSAGLRWRATGRMLIGIAVPTMVIALVGMVTHDRYGWANVVMANWATGDVAYGQHNELWFIDALVASLLVLTAVLSVPPVARWWHRDPWAVAFGVAVLALIPRFAVLATWEGVLRGILPTVFWLFAIGAALAYARTRGRQRLTLAVAAVGGITFFPDDPIRNLAILAGITALALVPNVRVPAWSVPVVSILASASLYIYLIQFQIIALVPTSLGATVAALAAGCLLWRLAHPHVQRLQSLLPAAEHPTHRNGAADHTTYRDH
ncbi:MAG: AMP-binding protein, partial [Actinobacteria bacterium]|nr:AMP-binding protein [Actinomycetota bacterium]